MKLGIWGPCRWIMFIMWDMLYLEKFEIDKSFSLCASTYAIGLFVFFSLRNISSLKVFIFELNDVLLGSIVCNCTCRVKETLFILYEQVKLTWVSYFNFIYNLNLFTYLVLDLNQSRIINLLSYYYFDV